MILTIDFSSVQLSVYIHATEDEEKTLNKIAEVLRIPPGLFSRTKTRGHFGNPIFMYSVRLSGESARSFVAHFVSCLDFTEKSTLRSELDRYVDDRGDLHLRIGKQELFDGRVVLRESGVVWVKVKPILQGSREQLVSAYRSLFMD